jgi:hypothetical protein
MCKSGTNFEGKFIQKNLDNSIFCVNTHTHTHTHTHIGSGI